MLDINLFREDKGGKPELIRESQRRRFADVTLVDKVIDLDKKWRNIKGKVDITKSYVKKISAAVGKKMKNKEPQGNPEDPLPAEWDGLKGEALDSRFLNKENPVDEQLAKLTVQQLKKFSTHISNYVEELEADANSLEKERNKTVVLIGNLVHESVVISNNEDNNGIVKTFGEAKANEGNKLKNHVDLMKMIQGMNTDAGSKTAGSRAYYLTGPLVRLNLALINYAIDFLSQRGFTPIYPPYFMNQSIMGEVAQLDDFDEQLYKVTGEGEDKYLIATSEQPICAYHRGEWLEEKDLPIKYVGYSACFRKEVGSHGRDTLGIFRVHQFEKIEQFCITTNKGDVSWKMQDEMIKNSEEFYQSLNLPYRVVNIVSGALNNAAAKKLDLEAWFPASQTYRELVSCSNCTDYQSRRLDVRLRESSVSDEKQYVHMLNSTLCATTRTMCCICENYQTEEGITVPEVLRPYMGGQTFIKFTATLQEEKKK